MEHQSDAGGTARQEPGEWRKGGTRVEAGGLLRGRGY